jgi:pyrroline-5-carboxylate reductase
MPSLEGAAPLLLVGAGKMGGAMLDGWFRNGLDPHSVTIVDPVVDPARRSEMEALGVTIVPSGADVRPAPFRIMVLAVKPQMVADVLPEIWRLAVPETVVISVAAGIRLDRLERAFEAGQPIVRAMPNTPAQVGHGMTVAVGNGSLSTDQKGVVDALLQSVGKVAWIGEEPLMDAVTAVSGSGPAYVFLLAECLAEAGVRAGLPPELAEQLARQTVVGGGALLGDSPLPAGQLRENVTSPNGTTAAALAVLMGEQGLQPLLAEAVAAAQRRSVELG